MILFWLLGLAFAQTQPDVDIETTTDEVVTDEVALQEKRETPAKAPAPAKRRFHYTNPGAYRYLYAPSAVPLQKGKGYVSQKLILTTFSYGLTENISLRVGSVPIPFFSTIGIQYATRLNEDWHVGGGVETILFPLASEFQLQTSFVPITVGYALATYGDKNSNITFGTGVLHDRFFSSGVIFQPLMIYGQKRLTDRLALLTENWIFLNLVAMAQPQLADIPSASNLSLRLIGRKHTLDLGVLLIFGMFTERTYDPVTREYDYSESRTISFDEPFPWIDYTWYFGGNASGKK